MLLALASAARHQTGPFVGRVVRAPGVAGGRMDVALDAEPAIVYESVAWRPGTPLPTPGALCLVAFDDRGDPWVIAWT